MSQNSAQINTRLESLQKHLVDEHSDNSILAKAVQSFRKMDYVGSSIGLIAKDESYATCITWWPMIAVLGTFSAGKSTFINSYLGVTLQRTGNQAVDDKFTVICYSHNNETKTLPGVALDADPRFPFFRISSDIKETNKIGQLHIDSYLQLKTCHSEKIRGKILIDSPGFDADDQRASTLRLTQHIIDLSDVVLVFFDARHPEPKAMRDTLEYLVSASINRADTNKFLYILNQMDVVAKEDNSEEVFSAWQRSLAASGLIAGKFYRIYDFNAAVPIEDPKVKKRYEERCAKDMADIDTRLQQIGVERSYRIVGRLEQTAKEIKTKIIVTLADMMKRWQRRVLILDSLVLATLTALTVTILSMTDSQHLLTDFAANIMAVDTLSLVILVLLLGIVGYMHFSIRSLSAQKELSKIAKEIGIDSDTYKQYAQAFGKCTALHRSIFLRTPAGWNDITQQITEEVMNEANSYIQELNDRFTNPSGSEEEEEKTPPVQNEKSTETRT